MLGRQHSAPAQAQLQCHAAMPQPPFSRLASILPCYIWLQLYQQGCRLGQQGSLVGRQLPRAAQP